MHPTPRNRVATRLVATLLVSTAVLAPASAAPAAARRAPIEDREPPREKIAVKELIRLAAERSDRVAVGWKSGAAALAPAALTWTSLGPQPITGEYWSGGTNAAGRVSCVAVHPSNHNVVYIAAAQGGVWKTTNGGTSWAPLTDALSSISSGWVTLDPANANVLYYGTGEQHYTGDGFYGDGLFKSVDAGANWAKVGAKSDVGSYIARVLVDPSNSSRVFVASDLGLVRSANGGSSWSVVWSGAPDAWGNDLVFDPASSVVMYAGIYGQGILKSVNGGDAWTFLGGGLPAAGTFERVNLAIAPSNGQVLYASFVGFDENLLGMYRSSDGGANWTKLTATPNYLVGQGSYDNCMIVDPANPNICYAGGVFPYDPGAGDAGVIKTVNGGASWSDITFGIDGSNVHPDEHALAFGSDGSLWIASDGGVWKTTDGGQTWQNRNTNLAITQFYKFGLHPSDPTQLLAGTQDNGTLLYQGTIDWPQLVGGDGGPCGYDPRDPTISYTTYIFMWYLYRFNSYNFDGDVTGPWQALNERASFANGPLTLDPHRAHTLLAGTYRVWRSNDDGGSWSAISPDLTDGGVLRAITYCPGVAGAYYSASTDGVVFFTSDDGATWNRRSAGLPVAFLPDVVVGPGNAQVAYTCARAPSGDRVFATGNAGVTWTSVTGDLPAGLSPHSLAADFRPTPDKLYLGTDYGVWTSSDGGVHWIRDSGGLPSCAVFDLQLDLVNGYALAATHGRGMWRAPLGIGPVAVAEGVEGRAPTLADVVPNPARFPATLAYELPRDTRVALEVFDLTGRRVRIVDAGWREAGRHEARWDGCGATGQAMPGGVYFYRLVADGKALTRRLVALR